MLACVCAHLFMRACVAQLTCLVFQQCWLACRSIYIHITHIMLHTPRTEWLYDLSRPCRRRRRRHSLDIFRYASKPLRIKMRHRPQPTATHTAHGSDAAAEATQAHRTHLTVAHKNPTCRTRPAMFASHAHKNTHAWATTTTPHQTPTIITNCHTCVGGHKGWISSHSVFVAATLIPCSRIANDKSTRPARTTMEADGVATLYTDMHNYTARQHTHTHMKVGQTIEHANKQTFRATHSPTPSQRPALPVQCCLRCSNVFALTRTARTPIAALCVLRCVCV